MKLDNIKVGDKFSTESKLLTTVGSGCPFYVQINF